MSDRIRMFAIGALCPLPFLSLALTGCPPPETVTVEAAEHAAQPLTVRWEELEGRGATEQSIHRTRTPTGWIVFTHWQNSFFVPDPEHKWLEHTELEVVVAEEVKRQLLGPGDEMEERQ